MDNSSSFDGKPVMPNPPNINVQQKNCNQIGNDNKEASTSGIGRKCPETMTYEMFLNGAGTLSCNSNDFEDLLKVKRHEGGGINSGDVDSLSLSSFMEISLPESAKLTANEITMDDLDSSNISLSNYFFVIFFV